MNKLFKKLFAPIAILTMAFGVTISTKVQPNEIGAHATTYSHVIGAKTWSAYGDQTLTGITWTAAATGGTYFAYDAIKGQQFGSGSNAASTLSLTTSGIAGTISSISVSTSGAASIVGTLSVKVGSTSFTPASFNLTSSNATYTFTGSATGLVSLNWAQTSSKAIYIKQIDITYEGAAVTGVTLDKSSMTLIQGQTSPLVATILPEAAANKAVSWSSDNGAVATVNNSGVVTAVSPGNATIIVTTVDGSKTATCAVTVNPKVLNSISIKTNATTTTFSLGKVFNYNGLSITANYNAGPEDLTNGFTVTGVDTNVLGAQTATITLGDKTTDYMVTVTNLGASVGVSNPASELFISEYIEGAVGNNKAFEIFNGTGADVALSDYSVALYANGAGTATPVSLSGTLQNGQVLSIVNSGATAAFKVGNYITSNVTFFNGNDAIALLKNNVVIDVIGVIGTDPGTAWTEGTVSTLDKTLVRKSTVTSPNTTFTYSEWDAYAPDTSTYIGSHVYNSADVTVLEQATAFANYVNTYGENKTGLCEATYNALLTEYNYMTVESKAEFANNVGTSFVNAEARMAYLSAWVAAHGSSPIRQATSSSNRNNLSAIVSISAIGLTSILGYFFISKKKRLS